MLAGAAIGYALLSLLPWPVNWIVYGFAIAVGACHWGFSGETKDNSECV